MFDYVCRNWSGIVIAMVMALFLFWFIGYFAKGLWGLNFDLNSCWAGVAAVTASGVIGLGKYYTDSKHNSRPGERPDSNCGGDKTC